MSKRTVLASYEGRNKLLTLPRQTPLEGDLAYLKQQFFRAFAVSSEFNEATFQRYNSTWDTNLDLEEDDEISDKDRLTVVCHASQPVAKTASSTRVSFLKFFFYANAFLPSYMQYKRSNATLKILMPILHN